MVGAFVGLLLGKRLKNNHILQTDSFFSIFFSFSLRPLINCPGLTVIFIIISALCCPTSQIACELIFASFIQVFVVLQFDAWSGWLLRHRNCFFSRRTSSRKSEFSQLYCWYEFSSYGDWKHLFLRHFLLKCDLFPEAKE